MTTKEAVAKLIEELQADQEYRWAWQSSIAMAYLDQVEQHPELSAWANANKAAERFLNQLCGD